MKRRKRNIFLDFFFNILVDFNIKYYFNANYLNIFSKNIYIYISGKDDMDLTSFTNKLKTNIRHLKIKTLYSLKKSTSCPRYVENA